ncbi:MAG: type II secretion system protein [Clostridia bacterium]|nr:type II secretion system protein [Clostridia bacterium]
MQKKNGISLIVLVITIIVMIILAASIVITLSNTGVINRANEAVDKTNEKQVQALAALTWADVYMDNLRGQDLIDKVTEELAKQGVTTDKWDITITDTGITVDNKNNGGGDNTQSGTGLGSLISKDNYGDKVDYTVTVDGTVYDDWQIYYHNSDYVYLIAETYVEEVSLDKGTTVASLTSDELALYEKFRVGNADKYTLADIVSGNGSNNSQSVAQLIKDYAKFANTTTYGTNVVGAIGGPTLELLVAGWNSKGYTPTMTLTTGTYGYKINNTYYVDVTSDGLYVPSDYWYWLASPSDFSADTVSLAGYDVLGGDNHTFCALPYGVRPVVCLKSSTPATVGTGDYDFNLTK